MKGLSLAGFILGIITVMCGAAITVLSAIRLSREES